MSRLFLWVVMLAAFGATAEPLLEAPALEPDQVVGDLQVWAWNIAAGSLNTLVPGFRRSYPNCQVDVHMSGANLQSRFLLSLSAGVGAPDISQLQIREAPRYSVTGRLADLTDVAGKYASMFPASFWQDCVHDGRVYALPWDMGPCAVFYKRGVFDRYGINPEMIETWDDFIAAGRDLAKRSQGKTKMLCLATGNMGDFFELLMQQNNAQIFDAQGRVSINSTAMLDVMALLKKMVASGIGANVSPWGPEFLASLKSDTVATYPTAAWFGGTIRDYAPDTSGTWGVFRLPAFRPGGLRTSNLGGSVLVIPDQCTQKIAAWKYIEYALCTPGPQIEQYRNFDLFPALTTTHNDPFFDEDVPFFGGQKVRRLFSMDIDKIPAMNRTTDWMEATRYITQALSKWATGDLEDPAILLKRLEDKLTRRLNRTVAP